MSDWHLGRAESQRLRDRRRRRVVGLPHHEQQSLAAGARRPGSAHRDERRLEDLVAIYEHLQSALPEARRTLTDQRVLDALAGTIETEGQQRRAKAEAASRDPVPLVARCLLIGASVVMLMLGTYMVLATIAGWVLSGPHYWQLITGVPGSTLFAGGTTILFRLTRSRS